MTQQHAATALLQAALRRRLVSVKEALALRHVLAGCGGDPQLVRGRLALLPGQISHETAAQLLALLPAAGATAEDSDGSRRLALLGQGDLGSTWLGLGRSGLVVLKDLGGHADAVALAAGLAPLLGSAHRYLVPYLAVMRRPSGGWTLVQHYRPGRDAWQRAEVKGEASESRTLALLRHAAKGLAQLHHLGLHHGRLHPGNILLDADGRAALGDHALDVPPASPLRSAAAGGRQAWAAPEELGDAPAGGPAADLYALGCIGYWLLAGNPPFPGTPERQALQHLGAARPDVREVAPGVSELTAKTLAKCMQVDPAERYRDARALIHSLERNLDLLDHPQAETGPTIINRQPRAVSPLLLEGLAGGEEESP